MWSWSYLCLLVGAGWTHILVHWFELPINLTTVIVGAIFSVASMYGCVYVGRLNLPKCIL